MLNWKDPLKYIFLFPNGITGLWWAKFSLSLKSAVKGEIMEEVENAILLTTSGSQPWEHLEDDLKGRYTLASEQTGVSEPWTFDDPECIRFEPLVLFTPSIYTHLGYPDRKRLISAPGGISWFQSLQQKLSCTSGSGWLGDGLVTNSMKVKKSSIEHHSGLITQT